MQKLQIKRCAAHDIKLADAGYNRHRVMAPAEHSVEDVLNPGYLWHGADRLRPHDIVEIVGERFGFYLELYVVRLDRDTQAVIYQILRQEMFGEARPAVAVDLSQARIERKGVDKWRIVIGETVISKGHASEDDAKAWLSKKQAA